MVNKFLFYKLDPVLNSAN